MSFSRDIKDGVSVSRRMIILLCGRAQCGLNAHSVDPDSVRIESWSSVDRPLVSGISRQLCSGSPGALTQEVSEGYDLIICHLQTKHYHRVFSGVGGELCPPRIFKT